MELVRLPMLYRKSSSGKILTWEVHVHGASIITESGMEGGKIKESVEKLEAGKNIGRANETSPHMQAIAEATSRWQKKKDRGYVESLEDAENGVDLIEGGYFPMLAKVFEPENFTGEQPHYVQPKLDGLRATNDKGQFFSRTRKPFQDIAHIREELESLGLIDVPLDGEFYHHDLKDNFEEIVSAIKRGKTEHPLLKEIEYHVFDVNMPNLSFESRLQFLLNRVPFAGVKVKLVETKSVLMPEEIDIWFNHYMRLGYEGLMIRSRHGLYLSDSSRRSDGLLKYKKMHDSEFKVIDIKEGRGKLKGHVGAFVCKHGDKTFEATLEGRQEFLKQCFENHSLWRDKWLTVKFQGFTNKKGVPRFPIGVRLREIE